PRRSISEGARSGNSTPTSPRRRAGMSCSPIRAARVFGRLRSGAVRRLNSSTRAAVMKSYWNAECGMKLIRSTLDLESRVQIMGALNVTPDSFSDGGKYDDLERAVARAFEIEAEGADILDIGGESTRPGAKPVSVAEELDRVIPVIEALRGRLRIPISVDTTKSEVARDSLRAGAEIINDISGLRFDPSMAGVAAETGAALVVMHSRGAPES